MPMGEIYALFPSLLEQRQGQGSKLSGGEALQTLKQRGMTILLAEQNCRFAGKIADGFYLMDHGLITEGFEAAELPARMASLRQALGV